MYIRSESELMFTGSDAPPPNKWHQKIIKVYDAEILTGIMCAADLTSHFQHYDGFRTQICLPNNCPLCAKDLPKKQMGYFPILLSRNQGHGFAEVPYSGFQYFDRHLQMHGTCEGWVVTMRRVNKKTNGRMWVGFTRWHGEQPKWPRFPETRKWLFQLWGITIGPLGGESETGVNSGLSEKTTPIIFRENAG